jgi:hypothetical protein
MGLEQILRDLVGAQNAEVQAIVQCVKDQELNQKRYKQ